MKRFSLDKLIQSKKYAFHNLPMVDVLNNPKKQWSLLLKDINRGRRYAYKHQIAVDWKEYVPEKYLFSHCFVANTPILMSDGTHKNIQDVNVGDEIITHQGETKKVTKTMSRFYEDELIELKVTGIHTPIYVTKEHPFYTQFKYKTCGCGCGQKIDWKLGKKFIHGHCHKVYGNSCFEEYQLNMKEFKNKEQQFIWTPANQLEVGDNIALGFIKSEQLKEDEEFAKLLGCYLSEGWIGKEYNKQCLDYGIYKTCNFAFSGDEEHTYVKDIAKILTNLTGKIPRITDKRPKSNCIVISVSDKTLADKLLKFGGKTSKYKRIYSDVFRWKLNLQKLVLAYWYRGDAGVTISYDLAWGMKYLANACYIPANLIHTKRKIDNKNVLHQESWLLQLKPTFKKEFQILFGCETSKQLSRTNRKNKVDIIDGKLKTRIKSIKYLSHRGVEVYNLSVEQHETYIANGVVTHNCSIVSSTATDETNYRIVSPCHELVNANGNAWTNEVLPHCYKTFIGGYNYLEHCFPAGTRVLMADGSYKTIEILKSGDEVVNRLGEMDVVKNLQIRESASFIKIKSSKFENNELVVTRNHPFWVLENNKFVWVDSHNLNPDIHKLTFPNGAGWASFSFMVETLELSVAESVYNIEVENDNSYIVEGCVVHNCQIPELSKGTILDAVLRPVTYIGKNGKDKADVWYCFVQGTKVLMANGDYQNIEEIEPGELVYDGKGNVNKVVANSINYSKNIYKLKIRGIIDPIECTYNHRIMAKENISDEWEWIEAENLKRNMWVYQPKLNINGTKKIDKDFAWFMGLYLAKGSLVDLSLANGKKQLIYTQIACHKNEKQNHLQTIEKVLQLIGKYKVPFFKSRWSNKHLIKMIDGNIDSKVKNNGANIRIRHRILADECYKLCGRGCRGKDINKEILYEWDDEAKKNFLAGFIDGDGSARCNVVSVKSVNNKVIRQVELILQTLGFAYTTTGSWNTSPYTGCVTIELDCYSSQEMRKYLKIKNKFDKAPEKINYCNRASVACKNGVARRIDSIEKMIVQNEIPVFDIEVENEHSFLVEGITVHNCDLLVATNRKHHNIVSRVENGELSTLSMGSIVNQVQCSYCGKIISDDDEDCEHLENSLKKFLWIGNQKFIVSELCGVLDKNGNYVKNSCNFIEASWVEQPAFGGAVVNYLINQPDFQNHKMAMTFELDNLMEGIFSKNYDKVRVADIHNIIALRLFMKTIKQRQLQNLIVNVQKNY